jgi:hypothetical protein
MPNPVETPEVRNDVFLIKHIHYFGSHKDYRSVGAPELKGGFCHFIDADLKQELWLSGTLIITRAILKNEK